MRKNAQGRFSSEVRAFANHPAKKTYRTICSPDAPFSRSPILKFFASAIDPSPNWF
jgi:hypothetical protein